MSEASRMLSEDADDAKSAMVASVLEDVKGPKGVVDGGTRFVRLIWVDSAGLRRCRVVPVARWEEVRMQGLGLTCAAMAMQSWGDVAAPESGLGPVGEVRMIPDTAVMYVLPWRPSHAMALVNLYAAPGTLWGCDPRGALKTALELLERESGCTLRCGFEHEFVLLRRDGGGGGLPPPVDRTAYCSTLALEGAADVLDDMAATLADLGIEVEQLHAESAPGQFEVVTTHFPASTAADMAVITREALAAVALKHGCVLSFLPKLSERAAGNGCHVHFSLWKDGKNVTAGTGPHGLSLLAQQFMGGLLAHLPALLPFTLASTNSYARMSPSCWAGAYSGWGVNNREAPLRLTGRSNDATTTNCEFKAFDATANPHIGLAAVVAAGLAGMRADASLPAPLYVDPGLLSDYELSAAGAARLPSSMAVALEAHAADAEFCRVAEEVLGRDLLIAYVAVKKAEAAHYGLMSFDEQVAVLYDKF